MTEKSSAPFATSHADIWKRLIAALKYWENEWGDVARGDSYAAPWDRELGEAIHAAGMQFIELSAPSETPLKRSIAAFSDTLDDFKLTEWERNRIMDFVTEQFNLIQKLEKQTTPSAIRRSTAPAARPAIGEANLSGWAVAWTAMERYADYLETQAARWEALLWRWGSGTVTLDCDDQGRFRLHVEHAEAADECHVGDAPESVIDSAISKEEQQNG